MSTFQELKAKMDSAQERKTILVHLITYLDAEFRSVAGKPPEKMLLTDSKATVSDAAFEKVIADILLKESDALTEEIEAINQSSLSDKKEETSPKKHGKKGEQVVQTPEQGEQK